MPESVQYDDLLVSDTSLCELYAAMMCVCAPCMLACLCVLLFIGARFERHRVYRGRGSI
jgi:hypothetical protein